MFFLAKTHAFPIKLRIFSYAFPINKQTFCPQVPCKFRDHHRRSVGDWWAFGGFLYTASL